jgi:dienelactone hydrolase
VLRYVSVMLMACVCFPSAASPTHAAERVVDLPTRSGVTQRMIVIVPAQATAAVVLFAGGHGGLQIDERGAMQWGRGNFLVRSRQLFADQGFAVAVIDAPSDRQSPRFLGGFRQSPEHAADVQAVIAWLRAELKLPVWLIGTSRGTQSVAAAAIRLRGSGGPDGIVLTSTILSDPRGRPVTDMAVEKIQVPILVVHHKEDACRSCLYSDIPRLMPKLSASARHELVIFRGGVNTGDPCEGRAYHGFNGLENDVVGRIAAWIR